MIISLCTPNMNRTEDLRKVMPSRLEAARLSPPVEICVVNYNSRDDLDDYIYSLEMPEGVTMTYRHYRGREYWHMAHAFNLAVLAGKGEYFWLMGTDVFMQPEAFKEVRELLEKRHDDLMYARAYRGMIVCRRDRFIEAGGYDEWFEFYGAEGDELNARLRRRGLQVGYFSNRLLSILPTSQKDKVANYRIKGSRTAFSRMMRPFYEESVRQGFMVANIGKDWGSWH